jgi:hypothetical protein
MRLPVAVDRPRAGTELSRAALVRRGAGALAVMSGLSAAVPRPGRAVVADSTAPKPIPGGFSRSFKPVPANPAAHVFQPLRGGELNTIGDFDGFVAATEIQGKARGSDGTAYSYDCDMRFMQGSYVALDGKLRQGTFGFI